MTLPNSCLIIAGEKSGEEHCLSFLPKLQQLNPSLHFWGVGGDEMKDCGVELLYHLTDFSSWGFSEVISKIPFYFSALDRITKEAVQRKCKMAILIDFQDFNMRLAKRLSARGVSIFYYVAPQAWAWKSWRAKALSQNVHTLFTILPFEKKWFKDRGVNQVVSIENPVLTHYKQLLGKGERKQTKHIVLLPGSRRFEVQNLLPLFVKVIKSLQQHFDIQVTLVKSTSVPSELFSCADGFPSVSNQELGEVLTNADFAIAASGTVTLTTALFGVPTVVTYKTSYFNEYVFDTFLGYDGPISLPNIILGKYVIPEFIQDDANEFNILKKMMGWLEYNDDYVEVKKELAKIPHLLEGEVSDVGAFMAKDSELIYG